MKPPVFLRGLWGDDAIPRRPKVQRDVKRSLAFAHQPAPQFVACYGRENLAYCEGLGLDAVLLDHEPLVDWLGTGERGADIHAPFGVSVWRHKLWAILRALDDHEAVVWLDWDCRLTRPLPGDFWDRLAAGRPFQAALTRYRFAKCPWRDDPEAQRIVPCGSWVYCRDRKLAALFVNIQTHTPARYDEQVYAGWTDAQLPDNLWTGPEGYIAAGFQPEGVLVHRAVFPCEQPLFYAPLRFRRKVAEFVQPGGRHGE